MWLDSPTHRSIMMATSYNYMGVGLAIDGSGKKLWTGVFMRGPDRTGGWVSINPVAQQAAAEPAAVPIAREGADRDAGISWRGGETRLRGPTPGVRSYQIQRRA